MMVKYAGTIVDNLQNVKGQKGHFENVLNVLFVRKWWKSEDKRDITTIGNVPNVLPAIRGCLCSIESKKCLVYAKLKKVLAPRFGKW